MSFTQMQAGQLHYLSSDLLRAQGGALHGFSTRLGGVSRGAFDSLNLGLSRGDAAESVRENHRRFLHAIGAEGAKAVFCRQVHSNRVQRVSEMDALVDPHGFSRGEADGMVSNTPGLALGVFYADCIPILLYDPCKKAVGAVHSGWRGTAGAIVQVAVEQMVTAFGSRPSDLLAAVGPGIEAACFETHRDVPDALAENLAAAVLEPFLRRAAGGKYWVDLKGIIALQLEQAGLRRGQISLSSLCTACHPELFWSHRRLGERRGNQAAMIALATP